jgi:hypothetical protein
MDLAAFTSQGSVMTAKIPTVIGLGRLVDFIIRDAQGKRLRVTPADERWLAWKPDTRDLVVLRPGHGEGMLANRGAARRHQRFHGAAPEQVRPMEWPTPHGALRSIAVVESVTYTASGIRSPSKNPHRWIHQFGDRGERGHGTTKTKTPNTFAERLRPRLDVDEVGNRFTVRDWIIG